MTKSPLDYNHKYVKIDGYNYHYVDEGNENGELLVFVHGWPELWICHKHQIEYFSKQGYRCVAVDLIGFGGSEGPKVTDKHNLEAEGLSNYTLKNNCKALNYLVKEELKREQAIFIGHDWGSLVVWRMSQYFPETVKALASTCIDYVAPAEKFIDLDTVIQHIPAMEYQRDIAYKNWEDECRENKRMAFETVYQYNEWKPDVQLPSGKRYLRLVDLKKNSEFIKQFKNYTPVYNEEEFEYFLSQYTDQNIANSCNYYRTRLLNFNDERELADKHYINQPALMVHATRDVTNDFYIDREPDTKKYCKNLTYKSIDGDHWIILNNKDAVNTAIHDWLKDLKL
ncbi:alpha/beta-hydrolase [Conidiobolus coronatus NRRL 28638]|uniref:Alpha/beta-hydrolase n=1 Tax=Conidiobolus coronatus (strain ATCC 28846 / CBS 209.66 / NRRL 28638) TaxID=796925 RepID=A0A137P4K1_CONC2|nr:alpha/beta-hydrolase [Conidiobolus coronatus NRRL 28638]|eukprot:KXN69923.1 alpha/beta-hydrolase [Conidiobolus coronatus NRRL 28638]